jgi:hypothetical protein
MTDQEPTPEGAVPVTTAPRAPLPTWDERIRLSFLTDWVAGQQGAFTEAALERTALATGYTHEEFVAAWQGAEARIAERAPLAPVRSNATRLVLLAYAVVWVLFAIPYLLGASTFNSGVGPILQGILTVSLGIGLAISLAVIRRGRPDSTRASRAMVLLLVVPVVLLVGIAGLCLPFVPRS